MKFAAQRFVLFVIALLCATSTLVRSQSVLPTYGTHFTFAIPEGPDLLPTDPFNPVLDSSILYLQIVSATAGQATIVSPSGYTQTVCYGTQTETTVMLPYSLMLIPGVGKSENGILVTTTSPVQLTLFDFFPEAGEMTQLYPDDALDTAYRVGTWGIYDDPGEDNKTEFVVTAPYDNTTVTISPSVPPIGAIDTTSFTITLNRGECYIVKADMSASAQISLSGSLIVADRPISVITGLTCGYVPLAVESCNELLNMPFPKQYTDTEFFTAPFDPSDQYALMFVSDSPNFFITTGGKTTLASNGVLVLPTVTGTQRMVCTAPAQCYELSVGSDVVGSGLSDPSMVNIPPRSQWMDSLECYIPELADAATGQLFETQVSIVYPQAVEQEVLVDGIAATSLTVPAPIPKSPYSNMIVELPPGIHTITSPQPIYATCSGFGIADAFSYTVMRMLPASLPDSIHTSVLLDTMSGAHVCAPTEIALRLNTAAADVVSDIQSSLTYDPAVFTFVSERNGAVATANTFTYTVVRPGLITIDLTNDPKIVAGDTICIFTFAPSNSGGSSPFSLSSNITGEFPGCETVASLASATLNVAPSQDSAKAEFSLTIPNATDGSQAVGSFSVVQQAFYPFDSINVRLQYDHNLLVLRSVTNGAIAPAGTVISPVTPVNATTEDIFVKFPAPIAAIGELLKLHFDVYVTAFDSTPVQCMVALGNDRPCPLTLVADPLQAEFHSNYICGDSSLNQFLRGVPLHISSIVPNPASSDLSIRFSAPLPSNTATVTLHNVLGNVVLSRTVMISSDRKSIEGIDLDAVASGVYMLEVTCNGQSATGELVIRN